MIKIEGLEKSYDSFHLGPFDLQVEQGAILGVFGHENSGKTTLLRLLWGYEQPDKGSVEIYGLTPHLEQIKLRRLVGFMSELIWWYPELTCGALLEFIGAFYKNWDQRYALDLMREFHLSEWHTIQELSHQQRVQLTLISALGHHPRMLILDHPTHTLKDKQRKQLIRFLRRLAQENKVTIVVSSDMSDDLDGIPDGSLVLNHGNVVESTV